MTAMAALTDPFQVNDLATLWAGPDTTGSPSVSGGLLLLPCTAAYSSVGSTAAYDLTSSSALARFYPDAGGASYQCYLQLKHVATGDYVQVGYDSGNLLTSIKQGGVTTAGTFAAYSATAMAWWRIRESAATLYLEYSADSVTWTVLWSTAYTMSVTALEAVIFTGHYAAGTDGTSRVAWFGLPAPSWRAARSGLPGDVTASDRSAQAAQFLLAHGVTVLYEGNALFTPSGSVGYGYGGITWTDLGAFDADQPFTTGASPVSLGRVTLPLSPQGGGAGVTVSLCADSGGNPGTVIASVTVPAEWLNQLAAPDGLPAGPLATAWSNTLRSGDMTVTPWASPLSAAGAPVAPASAQSGNYILQAGGETGGSTYQAKTFTVAWGGGTAPGTVLPQPALPAASDSGTLVATSDAAIYAGGYDGAALSAVWAAGWSPSAGQVQAWSAATALPQALYNAAGAFNTATDTVYVLGGNGATAGSTLATAYYATVSNGQLGAWQAGPALPVALYGAAAAVVGGWLVLAGGQDSSGTYRTEVYAAPLGAGGAPGPWVTWPAMPYAAVGAGEFIFLATAAGIAFVAGYNGSPVYQLQTLTVTSDGPGSWSSQALNPASYTPNSPQGGGAFDLGSGQWQVIGLGPAAGEYCSGVLSPVPAVSVPLPASLSASTTYHVLLHQEGGTAADFVQAASAPGALPSAGKTRPAGGGAWAAMPGTYSLFAEAFDRSPGGDLVHLWEDAGARVTTFVRAGSGGALLGVVEATAFPSGSPRAASAAVTQVTYDSAGLPSGTVQIA